MRVEFRCGRSHCRYWHIIPEDERTKRRTEMRNRGRRERDTEPPIVPFAAPSKRHAAEYDASGYDSSAIYQSTPAKRIVPQFDAFSASMPMQQPQQQLAAQQSHYAMELERQNAELRNEVESLRRELRREKERYDASSQRYDTLLERYDALVALLQTGTSTASAASTISTLTARIRADAAAPTQVPSANTAGISGYAAWIQPSTATSLSGLAKSESWLDPNQQRS